MTANITTSIDIDPTASTSAGFILEKSLFILDML